MENQNEISKEKFKNLIQQARALLNMSLQEFKDKYNELIQHINKGTLEIRLNKEKITINCLINEQECCTDIYFFFDKIEDEDAFIDHLVDYLDYSFRKRVWFLGSYMIKTEEIKDILTFHFYKQY